MAELEEDTRVNHSDYLKDAVEMLSKYLIFKRLTRLFVSRRLNQNSLPSLKRPKMLSTTGGILLRTILMLFWIRQPGISWLKRPQYSQDFKG